MKDSEYLEMPWSIEDTIENLNRIKEMLKRTLVNANMDGKAESDVKELEFDFDRAIQALEEVQACRAIGTVEEFKALKEKAEPKKPIRMDLCTCPSCGTHNEVFKKRRNTVTYDIVHCWHCGQVVEIKRD